jgi:hypothetical protein
MGDLDLVDLQALDAFEDGDDSIHPEPFMNLAAIREEAARRAKRLMAWMRACDELMASRQGGGE